MSKPRKAKGARPPAPLAPIRSAPAHRAALAELERLWASKPGSPDFDRFEVLAMLIERYEQERFPIEAPTPAEALQFRMEQMGMSPGDVAALLGGRSRLSELLTGKRVPSMTQARRMHELGVPADVLLGASPKPVKRFAVKKVRLHPVAETTDRGARIARIARIARADTRPAQKRARRPGRAHSESG